MDIVGCVAASGGVDVVGGGGGGCHWCRSGSGGGGGGGAIGRDGRRGAGGDDTGCRNRTSARARAGYNVARWRWGDVGIVGGVGRRDKWG